MQHFSTRFSWLQFLPRKLKVNISNKKMALLVPDLDLSSLDQTAFWAISDSISQRNWVP